MLSDPWVDWPPLFMSTGEQHPGPFFPPTPGFDLLLSQGWKLLSMVLCEALIFTKTEEMAVVILIFRL